MEENIDLCPTCGSFREGGVCDNRDTHPRNGEELVERLMKNWISQYYARKENNNE
jgi:hypothetical protein